MTGHLQKLSLLVKAFLVARKVLRDIMIRYICSVYDTERLMKLIMLAIVNIILKCRASFSCASLYLHCVFQNNPREMANLGAEERGVTFNNWSSMAFEYIHVK